MIGKIFLFGFCFVVSAMIKLYAQQEIQTMETESKVPELGQFHEIIYPIWHTAYPAKDCAAPRSYTPEVNRLSEKIFSAKVPNKLISKARRTFLSHLYFTSFELIFQNSTYII